MKFNPGDKVALRYFPHCIYIVGTVTEFFNKWGINHLGLQDVILITKDGPRKGDEQNYELIEHNYIIKFNDDLKELLK